MRKHSSLPPSAAKMWIACNPSAKKNAELPDQTSPFAQEGTDAHALCEYKLLKALGRDAKDPREDLTYYDQEMEDASDDYVSFVMEHAPAESEVMTEQRLDFSTYAPGGYGTGDCIVLSPDGNLNIIDFKYGKGIPVSAGNDKDGINPQLGCYALGALSAFDGIYDIETVSVSIFQPRLNIAETYTISKEELETWGREVLAPAADRASKGEGEFVAGDHCTFCKFKAQCRKRAEYQLELAKYDFAKPDSLEDDEVAAILDRVDGFISWANDIKDYALSQAIAGKEYAGYKLVEGRAVRKYTCDKAVAEAVSNAGFDPFERKVLGITAMTKLLGKEKFEELVGSYVMKPAGKPTLVPVSDKRRALNISAKEDFKEE